MSSVRIEAELKYWAADERPFGILAEAATLGPARLGAARVVAETDRYVDTTDLRLAALRWACRVREREGRVIVSLKGPAEHQPVDPLHRRPEIEGPAASTLDPRSWPASAARDRLLEMAAGRELVERFVLHQQRTERAVSIDGLRVGLLSMDRVGVLHEGIEVGQLAVVELELDDAPGGSVDHAPLAAALAAIPGLVADPASKLERALAMLPSARGGVTLPVGGEG